MPSNTLSKLHDHQDTVIALTAELNTALEQRKRLIKAAVSDERRPSDIARALDVSPSRATVLIREAMNGHA